MTHRHRGPHGSLAVCLAIAWIALTGTAAPLAGQLPPRVPERSSGQPAEVPAPEDPSLPLLSERSVVRLRLDCASEIGRHEVTLFGNGTVRLREGPPGEEELYLGELSGEELQGYLARIEEEDLSETDRRALHVEGPWVEQCVLELLPRGRDPNRTRTFEVARYQSVSLALSRILSIAGELAERVLKTAGPGLPLGYLPEEGDLLERTDGALFEVVRRTGDGGGVEVRGVQVPLTLYVPLGALQQVFLRLVDPAERDGWEHRLPVREIDPRPRRRPEEDG